VLQVIRDFLRDLHRCEGCDARDATISILREELRAKHEMIDFLQKSLLEENVNKQEMIDYFSGKARTQQTINSQASTMHSVPRAQGIQARIRRAEQHDAQEAIAISAQRKKEYEARINQLQPEIEVLDGVK
jgi:hypothetical protein